MSKKSINAGSGIKIADIGYDVLPARSTAAAMNNIRDYGLMAAIVVLIF